MSADLFLVMYSVQRAYNHNCMLTHRPGTFVMCTVSRDRTARGVGVGGGGVRVFSTCCCTLLPRDNFCLNLIGVVFIGF